MEKEIQKPKTKVEEYLEAKEKGYLFRSKKLLIKFKKQNELKPRRKVEIQQNLSIIALEHWDFEKRVKAIKDLNDLKTLVYLITSDKDEIIRYLAYNQLKQLKDNEKVKKYVKSLRPFVRHVFQQEIQKRIYQNEDVKIKRLSKSLKKGN